MPIELKMPALSPTMEEGTLARWLVKEGDAVKSGDILAEIETDKATMEYEAIDEGTVARIVVPEGEEGVKVGAVIALLAEEGEDAAAAKTAPEAKASTPEPKALPTNGCEDPNRRGDEGEPVERTPAQAEDHGRAPAGGAAFKASGDKGEDRIAASPLARRLAAQQGVDLSTLNGSGPHGRIVKADLEGAQSGKPQAAPAADGAKAAPATEPASTSKQAAVAQAESPWSAIPQEAVKLSSMRKTIARRLTESKQTVPHIYLTVDVNLDRLLKLRGQLNEGLSGRGIKLSVNDLLIKALAVALEQVPACNVQYTGDQLLMFKRADISVAVSIPHGLITPIIVDAGAKTMSKIAIEMKDLAGRAKEGKLQPEEYQGGTASLSNMGMFGIRQFEAVINPPQGMILAIGAGEQRPAVIGGSLQIATMMSATGSFDHRAIDGADGAQLMKAFREAVEAPMGMLA